MTDYMHLGTGKMWYICCYVQKKNGQSVFAKVNDNSGFIGVLSLTRLNYFSLIYRSK